ncbi:MAG: hypothetical protein H0X50_08470 [Nitrosopumilus sp.]|nr:hypothetical protein [Nitrosopumilus sp.]
MHNFIKQHILVNRWLTKEDKPGNWLIMIPVLKSNIHMELTAKQVNRISAAFRQSTEIIRGQYVLKFSPEKYVDLMYLCRTLVMVHNTNRQSVLPPL